MTCSGNYRPGWIGLLGCCLFAGCATITQCRDYVPDVKPLRKDRAVQVVHEYEQQRNDAQFQAALAAWQQGNDRGSREMLEKLFERAPDHRPAGLLLVQLYLLDEDISLARATIDTLAKKYPDDARVVHAHGLVAEAEGDHPKARRAYERALELDPHNETYVASAMGLADEEEPAGPTNSSTDADRLSFALLRAEVYLGLGEVERARELLLVADCPRGDAWEAMLARLGEEPQRRRSPDDGVDRTLAAEPKDPVSRSAALLTAAERDENAPRGSAGNSLRVKLTVGEENDGGHPPAELHQQASPLAIASPASPRPRLSSAELLERGENSFAAGATAAAGSYLSQAVSASPANEQIASQAAVMALRHDQPAIAAQLARQALGRSPESAAMYRILGMAQYRDSQFAAAETSLRRALALDNTHALSYFLLGSTLTKLGRQDEAREYLRQARQLDARYAVPQ